MSGLRLEFDETNQRQFGPCECCGMMTTRVWGYVYRMEEAIAAYFVEWTPGHPDAAASFDLIIGRWGEQVGNSDRRAASLEYRQLNGGPAFMAVDAAARPVGSSPLVGHALRRDEVIGTAVAVEVFAICDLIYLDDPRIDELRG